MTFDERFGAHFACPECGEQHFLLFPFGGGWEFTCFACGAIDRVVWMGGYRFLLTQKACVPSMKEAA